VQTQCPTPRSIEEAAYFEVPGAHLYTVLHQTTDPLARVFLVGPFASERLSSYYPWVRWARYLAERRVEVLRYDYRGIGESTGVFEEMSFDKWSEDVQLLTNWFANRSPRLPFLLHGLELGAILAGRSFHEGKGDGLLLWAPPLNANQALRSTLLQWAGLKQMLDSPENRTPVSEYIRQLQQNSPVDVQGYQWLGSLWHDSFDFDLPSALNDDTRASLLYKRPVRNIKLGKDASPLVKPFRGYVEVKDFTGLYSANFDWICDALALSNGEINEANNRNP
jgi:alpha-beta hydrolase superfamily lysophospholipase